MVAGDYFDLFDITERVYAAFDRPVPASDEDLGRQTIPT